jgi:RNA polymerase sigma-70 factor (ECF subfamily)
MSRPHDPADQPSAFPATRWSLVQRIQQGSEDDARRALEEICRSYWYPVYGFLRRSGHSQHDAEDLTQAFFQRLIEERSIRSAQMERGRLRSFLLGVLKRFLGDHFERQRAAKRGGRVKIVSIDEDEAESRYAREPEDLRSPDALFDRAWAMRVLTTAETHLGTECERADDLEAFEALREFLPLGENATPYRKVATRLGIAEPTLRLQVHRMRKRYAKLIEEEIAQTVGSSEEVKTELAHLMTVIGL